MWWSDYAESQGFDDFVVGAFEDFDDFVMLGYEDESVSGDDEPGLADLADLAATSTSCSQHPAVVLE